MPRLAIIAAISLFCSLLAATAPSAAAPPTPATAPAGSKSTPATPIAGGKPTPATATAGGKPTHVEADRMVSLKNENAVRFTGNVDARQGEMVIRSDEMTITYFAEGEKTPGGQEAGRKLKKLFAKGNVTVRDQGLTATGNAMEYFEVERKVILTGKAKVWQDNNLVTGDTVILFLDEGKSIVERGDKKNERVKAFFYSGGEGRDK